MNGALAILLGFPTVFWTFCLALCLLYWLTVIAGLADLDLLGGADGAMEAKAEALGEVKAEALAEAKAAMLGEVKAELLAEVKAEAIGEAKAELLGEASGGVFSDIFAALKLRSAPVTVVISLLVVWGWALTAFPMAALAGVPLFKTLLGKLAIFGLSGVVGLGLTGLCVRPLAPLFAAESGLKRDDLVSHIVEVDTGRVSDRFGQATVYSQGSDHVIQVRNDHEQNGLKKGSRALIVNYDDHRAAFLVEPLPDEPPNEEVRRRTAARGAASQGGAV